LLRAYTCHHSATPPVFQLRRSSPRPGFSILITSAPRSASTWLRMLPATRRDRSSTRTSSSGHLASGSNARGFIGDGSPGWRTLIIATSGAALQAEDVEIHGRRRERG
jgi:hypothetical protein